MSRPLRIWTCASLALIAVLLFVACDHQATPTARMPVVDQFRGTAQSTTTTNVTVTSTAPGVDQIGNHAYLEIFETVWQTVDRTFYDPAFDGLDWEGVREQYQPLIASTVSDEAFYELINEMLWELNVSHLFVVPRELWVEVMPASFAGGDAGLDVRLIDGVAVVTSVQAGSPAAQAGLRTGYVVQSIDGVPVKKIIQESLEHLLPPFNEQMKRNVNTTAVQSRIYGPAETEVVIAYLDENGELHEVSIRRASRERKSALGPVLPPFFLEFETRLLDDGIAYIRFSNFHPALSDDIIQAIESMHDAPGLIIDLRGNSGGQMDVTKAIARQLLTERTLFSHLTTRDGNSELVLYPKQNAYTGPVAILIDPLSLSASEHFAAGLQSIGRAVIVGERSPGNLLGGNLMQLPSDVGFIYPVVQISTPDGAVLEGRGVIPDIEVELDRDLLLDGVDSQLNAAAEHIAKELLMMDADASVHERMVHTDDVTLYANIAGDPDAGDVLLGIHGGPGMSSDYMSSLAQLASPALAVVLYDQRGTGRSTSPDPETANYDLNKYVADVEAIRVDLGVERLHLFGHSWGGLVALRYATAHPDRVASIVLMGSGAPTMAETLTANDNKAQRLADLQAQGVIPDTLTSVSDMLPAYFSDPGFEMPEELKDLHYDPTVEQLTWTALGEFDFSADVAQLQHPVLLLWGQDDPFGLEMLEAAKSALVGADAKVILLDNCGHFWHECPDAFFMELREFLDLPPTP